MKKYLFIVLLVGVWSCGTDKYDFIDENKRFNKRTGEVEYKIQNNWVVRDDFIEPADICKCLFEKGNSEYMQKNGDACRDAISKELGLENWEKDYNPQNTLLKAKFDTLAWKCVESYEGDTSGCTKSEARLFAIERMGINGKVISIDLIENNTTSWKATGSVITKDGDMSMKLGVVCDNGLNDVLYVSTNFSTDKTQFERYRKIYLEKKTINSQFDVLLEKTKLSNLPTNIMKFFSYNTPKEITLDLISFQRGWERGDWIHVGSSLEKVITIVDEEKDFARVAGAITANPALKERYFSNFITQLENSGLFKKIDVINKKTTSGMDIDNMTFVLKCEIEYLSKDEQGKDLEGDIINTIEEEIKGLKKEITSFVGKIITVNHYDDAMKLFSRFIEKNNLAVDNFNPSLAPLDEKQILNPETQENILLKKYPIDVELRGNFIDFGNFLHQLANSNYYLTVSNIQISQNPYLNGEQKFSFNAYFYTKNDYSDYYHENEKFTSFLKSESNALISWDRNPFNAIATPGKIDINDASITNEVEKDILLKVLNKYDIQLVADFNNEKIVLINDRRFRKGEYLNNDIIIHKIENDQITFKSGSITLIRKVGN